MATFLRGLISHARRRFWGCRTAQFLSSIPTRGEEEGTNFSQEENSVLISWKGQPSTWSRYHYVWLRDSCVCPQCFHPQTNQRLFDTLQLPLDVKPKRVSLTDEGLSVHWQDGHESVYPTKWLKQNSYEHKGLVASTEREAKRVIWGKEIALDPPCVEYSAVMEDDGAVLEWLKNIEKFGFCFVEQTPLEPEMSKRLLERVGVIRDTFYGAFWTFTADLSGRYMIVCVWGFPYIWACVCVSQHVCAHTCVSACVCARTCTWECVVCACMQSVCNRRHRLDTSVVFLRCSDTAYTNLHIDAHTDGNYFSEAPGM